LRVFDQSDGSGELRVLERGSKSRHGLRVRHVRRHFKDLSREMINTVKKTASTGVKRAAAGSRVKKPTRTFSLSAFEGYGRKPKSLARAAPVPGGLKKTRPNYQTLAKRAIVALSEGRSGVSTTEIRKWIEARYPVPDNATKQIRLALLAGVRAAQFVRVSGASFRLSAKALKKPARKTRKPKIASVTTKNIKGKKAPANKVQGAAARPAPLARHPSVDLAPKGVHRTKFTQPYKWQFRENNGVFMDYDYVASDIVEQCYQEYLKNPNMMDVRAVHSGHWNYQVDFINLKQTNVTHPAHTVRDIRRVAV